MTDRIQATTRRAVLAGASALPATALPALAIAGVAAEISPVRAKFEEWKRVHAWCENPDITDDERDGRVEVLCKLESALYAEPSRDSDDLALKMAVLSASDFSLRVEGDDAEALRPDVRRFFAERGQWLPGGNAGDPYSRAAVTATQLRPSPSDGGFPSASVEFTDGDQPGVRLRMG